MLRGAINIFSWHLGVAFVSYKYLLKVGNLALSELIVEQVAPVGVLIDHGMITAPSSAFLDVSTLVFLSEFALPQAQ